MSNERHDYEVWTFEVKRGYYECNPLSNRSEAITEVEGRDILRTVARADVADLLGSYEEVNSLLACGYVLYEMPVMRPVAYAQIAACESECLDWLDCDKVEP